MIEVVLVKRTFRCLCVFGLEKGSLRLQHYVIPKRVHRIPFAHADFSIILQFALFKIFNRPKVGEATFLNEKRPNLSKYEIPIVSIRF